MKREKRGRSEGLRRDMGGVEKEDGERCWDRENWERVGKEIDGVEEEKKEGKRWKWRKRNKVAGRRRNGEEREGEVGD